MSDWFVDSVNGDANYAGDSWALSLSGTDGVTNGTTTFTTAGGGLTGKAGRWMRLVTTMRQIVSVESDTSCTMDSTYPSGSSRSFWIGGAVQKATDLATAQVQAGDRIKHAKTSEIDSAGSLTWALGSTGVGFSSGRIKVVDQCESGWVGATNVTAAHGSINAIEGSYAVNLTIAAAFAGGKVAYKTLAGGPIDFSAYQGLSFMWAVRGSTQLATSHGWRICLCSDTTGDTPVDDMYFLPDTSAYNGNKNPQQVWKGGNLGASIQSVAIYVDNDPGTPTLDFDNIIAIKNDGNHLCHACVLSQGGDPVDEDWWGIKCFDSETSLVLNGIFRDGTDGAVSSYKVQAVLFPNYSSLNFSTGTRANPLVLSGGWDTGTDTQDGLTAWWSRRRGLSDYPAFSVGSTRDGYKFERFLYAATDYHPFITFSGYSSYITLKDIHIVGILNQIGAVIAGPSTGSTYDEGWHEWTLDNVRILGAGAGYMFTFSTSPIQSYRPWFKDWVVNDLKVCGARGVKFGGHWGLRGKNITIRDCVSNTSGFIVEYLNFDWEIDGLEITNGAEYGLRIEYHMEGRIYDLVTSGNSSGAIQVRQANLKLHNAQMAEATKFDGMSLVARVASFKHGGTANDHLITDNVGTVEDEASVRHTASGIAWAMKPTHADEIPLRVKVGSIAVAAGSYTISIWLRRDNAGITGRFYCPGGQLDGVDTEQSDSIGAAADIWEIQSLSVSPTEAGVLDVFVEAQGGTTYTLFVDDLAVA